MLRNLLLALLVVAAAAASTVHLSAAQKKSCDPSAPPSCQCDLKPVVSLPGYTQPPGIMVTAKHATNVSRHGCCTGGIGCSNQPCHTSLVIDATGTPASLWRIRTGGGDPVDYTGDFTHTVTMWILGCGESKSASVSLDGTTVAVFRADCQLCSLSEPN